MKKSITKEVTICDQCKKEAYVDACNHCGVEHCYDCRKTEGKEYPHGVYTSGSGDAYYCNKCDNELTASGADVVHSAYRAVTALRLEATAWGKEFERRREAAEATVKRLGKP